MILCPSLNEFTERDLLQRCLRRGGRLCLDISEYSLGSASRLLFVISKRMPCQSLLRNNMPQNFSTDNTWNSSSNSYRTSKHRQVDASNFTKVCRKVLFHPSTLPCYYIHKSANPELLLSVIL